MNQNDLAILIEDCLRRGKRIYQGRVVGASNAGGLVQVEMPVAIPGFGTIVSAIALNDCNGGQVTAFLDNDGRWLALSAAVSKAGATQITNFRRRRNQKKILTSPFKTLFIQIDPITGKTILYVGGDRASATLIAEI